ncbi:carbohydrate porin [Neokomagataea tanensis]|uniref:Carbohydrate porin n=3 Tax=Acetobacteraceae TaxID=433 RepID=A0A4Y6V5H5_9PROT|nr:carbohydrate porin [Neokomagataea tanensis]
MNAFFQRRFCTAAITSVMALACIFIFASKTHAQTETAHNLYTPTLYKARAFVMDGSGTFNVGPLIPSLYGNPHLFGDWGGAQSWMVKHGIFTSLMFNQEFMGNVTGGRTRSAVPSGQVAAEVDIDWQQLAGIPAFWTHILVVNGNGQSFSHTLGDSVTNPEQIYGARGNVVAHLVELYADKAFLNDRIILSLGDIPTGSFFAYDYLACSFMNVSVCSNFAPGKYNPGGRDWPSGNLGGVLRLRPTEQTYIEGGVFAISPHSYNGGISGWAMLQDGLALNRVTSQVEIGWMPEFGPHKLRGNYKIGAWYDNSTYPALYEDRYGNSYQASGLAPRQLAGMKTAWFMFDQMLIRNGPGIANGLIVLGGVGYSSGTITAMRDHEWLALIESGTPWHRPGDQAGVMMQHMQMSRSVSLQQESSLALNRAFLSNQWGQVWGIQNWENSYEAFYSIHIHKAAALQADMQYLEHPGATTRFKDALVLGGQFTVGF